MNTIHRISPRPAALGLLTGLLLVAAVAAGTGDGDLPHGPMTRLEFEMAKTVTGDPFGDKNGELGDAAAGSDRYDVLRYDLDLMIDPETQTIDGTVIMVFASKVPDLTEFVFDLRYTLTVDGVAHLIGALPFTHDADSVSVVLPQALAIGVEDSIIVSYSGVPQAPFINRGLMFKTHTRLPGGSQDDRSPIVANMSQPGYAQSWWPCKDKPGDKFLVSMKLTVPDDLVGVSNGTLISETPAGPGRTTYAWREDYPIATYLVSVAISDYVLLEEDCITSGLGSNVPLKNWVFLADVDDANIEFAPLCDMMDFCESRFGVYPFLGEKYGHAEFIWPGAMEHQTVTSIGHGSLDGGGTHGWLVVHELAHQWFGDSLTPAIWADIWLNEGFATYSEALWYEFSEGSDEYFTFMANHRNEAEWTSEGPVYDPFPIFPGRVIYDKGAWILHSLRGRMGDGPYFGLILEWTTSGDRPGGYVATQDFIDLASAWAGETLDNFLWPLLKEAYLPQIIFDYEISEGDAGADTKLSATLRQNQSRLFDNVFPLVVTTTNGTSTERIHLNTRSTTFDVEYAEAITQVQLDPEKWVMWDEAAPTVIPQGLQVVYPNPSAGNYVNFGYKLNQPSQVIVNVMDAMGREVFHRDLGTVSPDPVVNNYGWNVQTVNGAKVASGIYWVALEIGGQRYVSKFSVVR
jgi:aminopeptidase N